MLADPPTGASLENLYPALTQCFAIIICGYFAGRMNYISETEAKGIGTFVGTFSLPSLIFMSLAELDLSAVNWTFLLSILIAKAVVFGAVIAVTLLVGRPVNLPRAGIFAIFCTQSNDFAIGYPIVDALYKNTHPEYASYLYLMAPISLAILNPISFVLIEIGKRRRGAGSFAGTPNSVTSSPLHIDGPPSSGLAGTTSSISHADKCKLVMTVARNIICNPIIFMTILGILGNMMFRHTIPIYLGGTLKVLGSAFSASALFLLGLRMVGKVHKLRGATLVVPGILIIAKLLVLPLVTREVVSLLNAGYNASETLDLSTYGFLYGTFPAAPTVFVFATQYSIDVDLIASAMVACTFISAPLMFVSAKMITLTKTDPAEYIQQLDAFTFDVSIAGTAAGVWVIAFFMLTRRLIRMPHRITSYLIFSQLLSCIGAILWNTLDQKRGVPGYVQFAMFTVGVYSSRIWTAILAVSLLFLHCRGLCFVLKLQPFFIMAGWGLPVILSTLLLLFDKTNSLPYEKRNPNFVYGIFQAIVAVVLLVICFIITVGCLILHQRHRKRSQRYWTLANDVASTFNDANAAITNLSDANAINGSSSSSGFGDHDRASICDAAGTSSGECGNGNGSCIAAGSAGCCGGNNTLPTINEDPTPSPPAARRNVADIEDMFGKPNSLAITNDCGDLGAQTQMCPSGFGCPEVDRAHCQTVNQRYEDAADEDMELIEQEPDSHDPQILQHIVLLILLLCSMFVGLAISIWTLVMDQQLSGIYIELSFLDAALNCGQSLIVFAVFGTEWRELALPLLAKWRRLWRWCRLGSSEDLLVLPAWDELSPETRHTCDQFITHHLRKCKRDIAENKRWRIKIYRDVFAGSRLVDWLLEVGVARDRIEAVHYARHLIEGKVLRHINNVYHFYDRNLLYTFN